MDYWYQYMPDVLILNDWDMMTQALNGADKDGDLFFTTDNEVLLRNLRETIPILCAQRKAPKKVVTEEDLITANLNSFGDDIGAITNRVTAMFDIMSYFKADSEEYQILEYRIKCGQL